MKIPMHVFESEHSYLDVRNLINTVFAVLSCILQTRFPKKGPLSFKIDEAALLQPVRLLKLSRIAGAMFAPFSPFILFKGGKGFTFWSFEDA